MDYEIAVGLEVHIELKTDSKIFCGCSTSFGAPPNTQCCPVCSGMPGVLPVLNQKAVEYAVKAGLAANCSISGYTVLDRKNYFYPDLPKAYQISQLYMPLCTNGHMYIETIDGIKKVRIREIHLEEDAGKLLHDEHGRGTYIDFNRCGVPLIEIVTMPDLGSSDEVRVFLEKLKAIIKYTQISDCKMQEGSLRVDVNVSVSKKGSGTIGTKTEMKNLNSFRSITRAVDSESARQIKIIESGGRVIQETRRWNDTKGTSRSMRSKEDAHDYRYFPEPDILPIMIDEEWIKEIQKSIPELPDRKTARYKKEYMLPDYDASILTASKELSEFFEMTAGYGADPKSISNWMIGEYMKLHNESGNEEYVFAFTPENLAVMIRRINDGSITGKIAKDIFKKMFYEGSDPDSIIKNEGISVISDPRELETIIRNVITENADTVSDLKKGKSKASGYLVGQVMKATGGKADPRKVNELLEKILNGII